jgi:hypothetical protein
VKLTLMPVLLAVVCVIAGCASPAETAGTARPTPAPTQSFTDPVAAVLTLPVVNSRPVGKSDAKLFTMSVPLSAPIGSRSVLQQ